MKFKEIYKSLIMKVKSEEEIAYEDCFESYYREHLDQLNSDYHPYSYANFSIDFLREISTLHNIDIKWIIAYEYNDWLATHNSTMTIYDWVIQYRPELLEFLK